MTEVSFQYDMDQKVKTPFGEVGLVQMLGFDEGGKKYYVATANAATWLKEGQLTPAKEA